ncbi:MAG: hypothetical protein QNL04_05090 [SAR324 cluster bacterium]|nr:hypothetical protein [SAR324 cluster bacterium]
MFKKLLILAVICTLASPQVYAMSTAKDWVNKIKPGTFDTGQKDASADSAPKERKFDESEMKVLIALKIREEKLRKREEEFRSKTQELKLLSQQIEQKLDQMRVLQANIEKRRKERKEMDAKDISRMVKYYETMGSDNTAAFFNQMDRVTATHLIMRMNPRKASAVMQLLEPKVAVEITERVTRFKENRGDLVPK